MNKRQRKKLKPEDDDYNIIFEGLVLHLYPRKEKDKHNFKGDCKCNPFYHSIYIKHNTINYIHKQDNNTKDTVKIKIG